MPGGAQDENRSFFEGQPFFWRKNAPRGCLQHTSIGFLKDNLFLFGKKRPARVLTGHIYRFSVDNPEKLKKSDFWKFLGMGWPGVENVPRACTSILRISRGSQEPYKKKINFLFFLYKTPDIPPRRPDIINIPNKFDGMIELREGRAMC